MGGAFSIWISPGLCQWVGVCPIWQPKGSQFPGLLHSDSQLRQINSACPLLTITLMKLTHWGLPLQRVDSSAGHGGRECLMRLMVVVTFVTHQAEPVVHCPQVVNNCSLILALLHTPGAVGQTIEVAKGIWVVYTHQSHNLWGL